MSQKFVALTVILEEEYTQEQCDKIIEAILMIRGVLTASTTISDPDRWWCKYTLKQQFGEKLQEVMKDIRNA